MAFARTQPLEDRIEGIRAEIDKLIDAKSKAISKESPGVPIDVIRGLITARGGNCQCRQWLEIKSTDDAA
jgi:hypothetical protein